MELNKYDLVEYLALHLSKNTPCLDCTPSLDCPIIKECRERKREDDICLDEDETRNLLIKKYNL